MIDTAFKLATDNLIIMIALLIVFSVIFVVYPNRKYRYIAIKDTFQEKLLRLFIVVIMLCAYPIILIPFLGIPVNLLEEYTPIILLIFYLLTLETSGILPNIQQCKDNRQSAVLLYSAALRP